MFNTSSDFRLNEQDQITLTDVFVNARSGDRVTLVTVFEGETLGQGHLVAYDFIGEVD